MKNTENLINLINAVKKNPKLFKNSTQNDDFKKWTAVAEECNITVSEAQDQWNLLLIEYVEYLRSNQDFNLAQHMDFLQPYFFTTTDSDGLDEEELLNVIETKKNEESEDIKDETAKNTVNLKNIIKTLRINKIEMASTICNQQIQSTDIELNNRSSSLTNLSSLELIFLGYAKQLEKMPLALQLKTKRKIAELMDEAELQMIS